MNEEGFNIEEYLSGGQEDEMPIEEVKDVEEPKEEKPKKEAKGKEKPGVNPELFDD